MGRFSPAPMGAPSSLASFQAVRVCVMHLSNEMAFLHSLHLSCRVVLENPPLVTWWPLTQTKRRLFFWKFPRMKFFLSSRPSGLGSSRRLCRSRMSLRGHLVTSSLMDKTAPVQSSVSLSELFTDCLSESDSDWSVDNSPWDSSDDEESEFSGQLRIFGTILGANGVISKASGEDGG